MVDPGWWTSPYRDFGGAKGVGSAPSRDFGIGISVVQRTPITDLSRSRNGLALLYYHVVGRILCLHRPKVVLLADR
jgi:hypothetical protein